MRVIVLVTIMFVNIVFANQGNSTTNLNNSNNYFIENHGQWPDEVRFLARIGGMDAWITSQGILCDYYLTQIKEDDLIKTNGHIVSSVFGENSSQMSFTGKDKMSSKHNYIIGDIDKWKRELSPDVIRRIEDIAERSRLLNYFS